MLLLLLVAIALLVGVLFRVDRLLLGVIPKEWVIVAGLVLVSMGFVIVSVSTLGVSLMVLELLVIMFAGIATVMFAARTRHLYGAQAFLPGFLQKAYSDFIGLKGGGSAYANSLGFSQVKLA